MIYLFERFRQVEVLLGDFRQIELITVEVWLLELSLIGVDFSILVPLEKSHTRLLTTASMWVP